MKNLIRITLLLFPLFAFAQASSVGDVKYSILNPATFTRLNGPAWTLMDGKNIEGSKLAELTGRQVLPDARGLFIRSLNSSREDGKGDLEGERMAGSYQPDMVGPHTHQYDDAYYSECCGPRGDQHLRGHKGPGGEDDDNGRYTTSETTADPGGVETRPRNIALYVYIKVNEQ